MKEIKMFFNVAQQLAQNTNIIIVANVKEITKNYSDYSISPVLTEYLSIVELEDIKRATESIGFSTSIYYDESDFIRDVSTNAYTTSKKFSIVMNTAQKGKKVGRKSLIPAFCDLHELMYMNSNPYVVSLCRNKYHSSSLLNTHKIPSPESWMYHRSSGWTFEKKPPNGKKIIIKLNNESASIGLDENNIITYSKKTEPIIHEISCTYDQEVIVQEFIEGYEVEVPFFNIDSTIPLEPVGISLFQQKFLGNGILSYDIRGKEKYDFYNFAEANSICSQELKKTTIEVAKLLGISGFGRIDYRINLEGRYFVTDIATSPHIVEHSSFYYRFKELGYSYEYMMGCLIGLNLSKYSLYP
jgi:D-alanine-D-alanine ligase